MPEPRGEVAAKFRNQMRESEAHARVIRDVLLSKRDENTESTPAA